MNNIKRKLSELNVKYCNFMNIEKLPDYETNVFKNNNSTHTYVEFGENKPILNIHSDYFPLLKSNATPVIFHELTHILDNSILLPELAIDKRHILTSMYSEYHAVQVQMKSSLHFETFDTDYKFKLETKVHDWFDNKNVKEDIVYKTNDFIATIRSILNNKREIYTYYLVLHCVYYQSMCDFWKNYCQSDITNMLKDNVFKTFFGTEYEIFHHMLKNIKDRDVNYFNLLYSSQIKMVEYFGEHEEEIIKGLEVN